VNRSITEGRKRFLNVFGEIESGEACETYSEVLSALAAGAATSAQVVSIRPHLRHCAACRAAVREMRFSRAKRLALFGPFAWLARLLSRPEVYAVSTGGGRFGPAAAAIGLCLSLHLQCVDISRVHFPLGKSGNGMHETPIFPYFPLRISRGAHTCMCPQECYRKGNGGNCYNVVKH
jgi:hypothetical protein